MVYYNNLHMSNPLLLSDPKGGYVIEGGHLNQGGRLIKEKLGLGTMGGET